MIICAEKSGIKLNGVEIPGIFQSLSINGQYTLETSNSPVSGASQKILGASKDRSISINMLLLPTDIQTVYQQLEEIDRLFSNQSDDNPQAIEIFHQHIVSRNITHVLFMGFTSEEDNSNDTMSVSLQFEESSPPPKKD